MQQFDITRRLFAEALGTAILLATVVGSGIMGERLADGNPAVTIARSFTDTFSGILPGHAPAFILAQVVGAVMATVLFAWLLQPEQTIAVSSKDQADTL